MKDTKTGEQINAMRADVYGREFIEPCNEGAVLERMENIIKTTLKEPDRDFHVHYDGEKCELTISSEEGATYICKDVNFYDLDSFISDYLYSHY